LIEVPNPPDITRNHFNCPHCGAHSNQTSFQLAANQIDKGGTPHFPDDHFIDGMKADRELDNELKQSLISWAKTIDKGQVFIEQQESGHYLYNSVFNLYLSQCFTCKKFAVWVYKNLLFPSKVYTIPPNQDLPDDVRRDYEEASEILDKSPRGSAALLRLAIQKLCIYLGEPGKNINTDIASLMKRGLNKQVQQALDVVRVIGNNALHPGQIDG
jgi:hypothetical protein